MMAGHSKWANTKRRKESQDSKKAKLFTKLIKEIIIATQQDGDNPEQNARLRLAIQNAKEANIPKDNITRAIRKATDAAHNADYAKIYYEGYAPHGIAVLIETLTDNRNRTVAALRACFRKYNGSLDKKGAIQHLFHHQGRFLIPPLPPKDRETITMQLIEAGVEDIQEQPDHMQLTCLPASFAQVQKAFAQHGITPTQACLTYFPRTTIALEKSLAVKVQQCLSDLEDIKDVQQLYHNLAPIA